MPPQLKTPVSLSENALTVLKHRYLWKDEKGLAQETVSELFARVAKAISSVEKPSVRSAWAERYYELMASLRFLPNSPTLMNGGRLDGQLSACFVLPVEDSLEGLFDTLGNAAKIHQSGGGTGFSFSEVRPRGSRVRSTSGVASGPVSFIRVFDVATEAIKQGGARRGANMAVLAVDHPDIFDFIDSKRDMKSMTNFNLSVGATGAFMEAVEQAGLFPLRDPNDGRVVKQIRAVELFERICLSAWECGDPGLIFLDRINFFNPTPSEGQMVSTNPCGEQPLLAYESCNLGSLNLLKYCRRQSVDWALLAEDIATATRFLDAVIDVNHYPLPECEFITKKNRKIGLGVMGFGDLLLELGIPYGSFAGLCLGEKIMAFLDREAKRYSAALAVEKGPFPSFNRSLWKVLKYPKLRNATVSTVAPTGTISMIAGVSSGIEPIFAGIFFRNVLSGKKLRDVHPIVSKILGEKGLLIDRTSEEDLPHLLGPGWSPARSVSVESHVRMQAVFQRFSDSAISKTINLPERATVQSVQSAYRLAYSLGCKGITVYRDRSKPEQVLFTERNLSSGPGENCPTC